MQTTNPKQSFTRECAFLALVRLMQTKSLSSISVTELTKKAGISRTAFYKNYSSVEDVIVKYFDSNHLGLIWEDEKMENLSAAAIVKNLISGHFEWLSDNKYLMKKLLITDNMFLYNSWVKRNFHDSLSWLMSYLGFVTTYEISACSGIFCELVRDWVSSGMDDKSRHAAEGSLYHMLYVYKHAADRASVHFTSPKHLGRLRSFNGVGHFNFSLSGESVTAYVLVEHDIISSCSAEVVATHGKEDFLNAASDAACSFVCGQPTVAALSITASDVSRMLNGLPEDYMYCAALAAGAIKNASIDFYNRLSLAHSLSGEEAGSLLMSY